VTAPLRKYSV